MVDPLEGDGGPPEDGPWSDIPTVDLTDDTIDLGLDDSQSDSAPLIEPSHMAPPEAGPAPIAEVDAVE